MKSTAIGMLVCLNLLLFAALIGRYMEPNFARAQAPRPGDYMVIPVDFTGASSGSVVVLDNATGEMAAIAADENQKRMQTLPRLNINQLFDAAGGSRKPR